MIRKPELFILGAPKCGTTSLADWLQQHPNVFMCEPKEPHYFNFDSDHHHAKTLDHYESLFSSVAPEHQVVGEASVWYLVSEVAVDEILKYQSDAKFVVCLRNPIEVAVSLHSQKMFSGGENRSSFEQAWAAQWARKEGTEALPPTCTDYRHIMYGESALFGAMLESLFEKVDRKRVSVILMDDLKADPQGVYRELEGFLGLPEFAQVDLKTVNKAKRRRLQWVARLHRHFTLIKNRLGLRFNTGLGAKINRWNRVDKKTDPISPRFRAELVDYFRDDVIRLGELLDRDLSHWLEGGVNAPK